MPPYRARALRAKAYLSASLWDYCTYSSDGELGPKRDTKGRFCDIAKCETGLRPGFSSFALSESHLN